MTLLHESEFKYSQVGVDAAGRVRIGTPTTLIDVKQPEYQDVYLWSSSTTETVTGTYADGMFTMEVYGGVSEYNYQTKSYLAYFSGKSQLIEETQDNFAPQSGTAKQIGYFSFHSGTMMDGFYLESSSGTIALHSWRMGVETLNKTISQWSGYSQLSEYQNPDTWDNFTVFFYDFVCLGGAILRLWLKTSTGFVLAHAFHYSGTTKDTITRFPTHPLHYRIKSSGGTGKLRVICSQGATEGSIDESGKSTAVDNDTTGVTCASAGTTYPILAIRKNSSYKHLAWLIQTMSIFVGSVNDQVRYSLQISPTLSAPLTYSNTPTQAGLQKAVGNGTITVATPGHILLSDYISYGESIDNTPLHKNFYAWLGINADDTPVEYVLCATPLTPNVTVYGALGLKGF